VATKGVRFGHVALRTADVERILRWYDDAFGAKKVFHVPRDGERQELMFLEFAKGRYIETFTNGKPRIEQPADAVNELPTRTLSPFRNCENEQLSEDYPW